MVKIVKKFPCRRRKGDVVKRVEYLMMVPDRELTKTLRELARQYAKELLTHFSVEPSNLFGRGAKNFLVSFTGYDGAAEKVLEKLQ